MSVSDKISMKTGDAAPAFKNLPGVDGRTHSLSDFKDATALVVFFSCNHCPYVQAYEDRIMDLQREFGPRGAQFVAINANDAEAYPDDGFNSMVARARDRKFNFVYLRDDSQAVARAYGATHTPHLFVFDPSRRLAYTGKIDDNWQNPSAVTRRYLREALEAVLDGRVPSEPATFAIGCTIKWKR